MSTHGELFVNSGKAYCAPMDGFCVPFSVKRKVSFPPFPLMVRMEEAICFDSENHRFLASSILGFSDYMVPNSATQDIRNYGTKWTDQKPVGTYLMSSDESNVFDPNKIDPSLEVHDIVTGGNGEILLMQLLLPITEKS